MSIHSTQSRGLSQNTRFLSILRPANLTPLPSSDPIRMGGKKWNTGTYGSPVVRTPKNWSTASIIAQEWNFIILFIFFSKFTSVWFFWTVDLFVVTNRKFLFNYFWLWDHSHSLRSKLTGNIVLKFVKGFLNIFFFSFQTCLLFVRGLKKGINLILQQGHHARKTW